MGWSAKVLHRRFDIVVAVATPMPLALSKKHFIKHNNKYIKSPLNKVLLNRSLFLVSFVSLIQYQTDLFTCSPLTKDCSTRIYSESMGVVYCLWRTMHTFDTIKELHWAFEFES